MRRLVPIITLVFLLACAKATKQAGQEDLSKIEKLMKEQESAWNQGDLEDFMLPYWNSDSLIFIGKRGPTYGWKKTRDNYKKSYPDKEAMGILKFTNLEIKPVGEENALVIGKWELFRIADTLSGHYSLIWAKKNGSWKIIADHSS